MSNNTKKEDEEKKKKKRKKLMYLKLDDERFIINKEYAAESSIMGTLHEIRFHGRIYVPIEGKRSYIIRKALEFCKERGEIRKKHQDADEKFLQDKLKDFDTNFLQHNQADAFDLADAACRLQIKSLFYLMTSFLADTMAQKTSDDIHKIFDIYYHQDSVVNFGKLKMMVVDNNGNNDVGKGLERWNEEGESGIKGVRPGALVVPPPVRLSGVVVDDLGSNWELIRGFSGPDLNEDVVNIGGDNDGDEVISNAATEVECSISPNGPLKYSSTSIKNWQKGGVSWKGVVRNCL